MKLSLIIFVCLITSCSGIKKTLTSLDEEQKPNIVFFLVDDLGWKDIGVMGSTYYKTPAIDKLASEGMLFTNAYANAPNCAPSRASLLTGLYTPRHGVYTVGNSERGAAKDRKLIPYPNKKVLDGSYLTIAEVLKKQGYTNAHIGKWHLGNSMETSPKSQGFDVSIGNNNKGAPKTYFSPYNNVNLPDGPKGEYLTDRLTDEALNFITQHKEAPFFLYLSHFGVHTPIQAKKNLIKNYSERKGSLGQDNPVYAAMIESVDQSLARVMQRLKALDLAKNTIVIFFSDNGGFGRVTTHNPLKGSKGMMYEGGIRVPMIVRWPNHIKPETREEEPVIGVDFFPTLSAIAGHKELKVDGKSLIPLFDQKGKFERKALYWHFPAYLEAYTGLKTPEDLVNGWRAVPSSAIRKGDWKLIENFETKDFQLFNLKEDCAESKNLATVALSKLEELKTDLKNWREAIDAPVPTTLNPKYIEHK